MANKVAAMITNYLCKNKTIHEDNKEIYSYGFEIMLSNITNFLLILVIGLLYNNVIHTLVFYFVFVVTRSYSGGYHAKNYFKCNMIFASICFITLFLSNLLNKNMSLVYLVVFLSIYLGCIFEYAPIDSENKRLTVEEKEKYKKISQNISYIWSGIIVILYFTAKEYATTLTLTLVMIAVLMLIEVNKTREND